MIQYIDTKPDQQRETINTRQRYDALEAANLRAHNFRGSMFWKKKGEREYLVRSRGDPVTGKSLQKSLGVRSEDTEKIKRLYDQERPATLQSVTELNATLKRQAAINRVLGLGRVPLQTAKIIRKLESKGLFSNGIMIIGTNALYAYESAAGVHFSSDITATEDFDLLMDSRRSLKLVTGEAKPEMLLSLLRSVDRSYVRQKNAFRAQNNQGFFVDLVKPQPRPPWKNGPSTISGNKEDLTASPIEGLQWLQNAPMFNAIAIGVDGNPVPLKVPDPRAFAIHKFWLSQRKDRDPLRQKRDKIQSAVIASLTKDRFPHLPFETTQLKMFPDEIVKDAFSWFQTQ